jgi:hypothetical protein
MSGGNNTHICRWRRLRRSPSTGRMLVGIFYGGDVGTPRSRTACLGGVRPAFSWVRPAPCALYFPKANHHVNYTAFSRCVRKCGVQGGGGR